MVIGIDLGTTNSLVSVWRNGRAELIPNSFGEYLTPSVVSFDSDGTVYVGKTAQERLITHPETTFREFKRQMGTECQFVAYGKSYQPQELSALILRQLRSDAEAFLGEPVEEAVISVPAYFDDRRRAATRNAGLLAGLKVERLINEPSAAALANHIHNMDLDEVFVVFDFGGGTLDVSLVDAFDNMIEIQGVAGDNHLGGGDFNEVIAIDMCAKSELPWGKISPQQKALLYREAEQVKIKLSHQNEVETTIRMEGKEYQYTLTNQQLIDLSSGLFRRMNQVLRRLMNDAQITVEDVSKVLMVGGSSKMPVVRHFVASLFDKKLCNDSNPDEIVCMGAGTLSGIKERMSEIKDVVILDICPFTLGIGIRGDIMSPIISRNQSLPCSRVEQYVTMYDGQNKIELNVFQGEHRIASSNLKLTSYVIDIPPRPKGEVFIDVRFSYDINGIFDIDVDCPMAVAQIHDRLGNGGGLDSGELERRRQELEHMKIHPRELEQTKYVLEKAERLYVECNEQQKRLLEIALRQFQDILKLQDLQAAKKAYVKFEIQLAMIEKTLFRFAEFDAGMWEDMMQENLEQDEIASDDGSKDH